MSNKTKNCTVGVERYTNECLCVDSEASGRAVQEIAALRPPFE